MNFLLINDTLDIGGGSNIACIRIIRKLLQNPQNSITWIGYSNSIDKVISILNEDDRVKLNPIRIRRTFLDLFFNYRAYESIKNFTKDKKIDLVIVCNIHNFLSPLFLLHLFRQKYKTLFYPFDNWYWCERKYNYNKDYNDLAPCRLCLQRPSIKMIKYHCGGRVKSYIRYLIRKFWLFELFKKFDYYIAPSNFFIDIYKMRGIPDNHILRIDYPIEIPNEIKRSDQIGKYILYYGTDYEAKGLPFLMKFWKMDESLPDLYIALLNSKIISDSKNIKIFNDTSWNNGLEDLILNAQCIIIPSLWDTPGEQVLYESFLYSKAVILFPFGYHNEMLVKDDYIKVEPFNINQLIKIMGECDINEIGRTSRENFIKRQHKWGETIESLVEIN